MGNYRIYFNTKMLDDALLKSYVTPQIVEESSRYVESVALGLGVPASAIVSPTPDIVRRLALYFAYFTAAMRKASYSVGKEAEKDSFHLKMRAYKELLDEVEGRLTAESFTGGTLAKKRTFPATMSMLRN